MNINFDKTRRLQANIQNAVEVFTFMKLWLKVERKYKKDNSGQRIEYGEQLAFNEHTNRSINEYLLCILWRLSPIVFHCADEEIHEVIEERYGNYSDSYKKLLLSIAREHNPKIEDIEQEFIENLSSYNPDSINSLINIYRVQWKGHIPHVTIQFGHYAKAYNDENHPLHNVLHEAEDSGLLDFGEIHVILDSLDWIAQTLKSIGESLNKLFEKWQNTTAQEYSGAGQSMPTAAKTEKGTMKVKTDVLTEILGKAGIDTLNADKAKIARLISYLTGYSDNTIRQRLSDKEELTSAHKEEVDNINKLLKSLNTGISITYNNNR